MAKVFLSCLIALNCLPRAVSAAAPPDLVIYYKQTKRFLPKVRIENRDYLPLIDLLQMLDLPYSESASIGFISIEAGRSKVKLTKDRNTAQVNERTVALSAAVVIAQQRWLVPPDFITRVLNLAFPEKITVSSSGNRVLIGPGSFNRLDIKGFSSAQNSTIVVQMSAPVEAEVKREDLRMTFTFGNAPLEPVRDEYDYKDEFVNSIHFSESSSNQLLVVELSDKTVQAKVTRLALQNAYLVELTRPSTAVNAEGEVGLSPPAVIKPFQQGHKWRHVTIDPGHGGEDRGAQIKENLFEKDVTLIIARKIRWAVQTRLSVDAVLTRQDDQMIPLDQRALVANAAQSDLFLSIHIGNRNRSSEFSSLAYVTKFLSTAAGPEGANAPDQTTPIQFLPWDQAQLLSLQWSRRLAQIVQFEMNQKLNVGNASLTFRDAPLKLLSSLAMPAVLVELGNASQPEWKAMITDSRFQDSVVATLVAALEKFRPLYEKP